MNMENEIPRASASSVIDFHAHLLPAIDDGSASIEESVQILSAEREQGISAVIATPHFYPEEESLESFLDRRKAARERLLSVYDADLYPTVYLGAEVAFFAGIGRSRFTSELAVVGTNMILVEMPFARWSETEIDEICFLRDSIGLIPVIAHIERYAKYQKRGTIEKLMKNGVLLQSNAEYLINPKTSKKAIKQFLSGEIAVLGSDCHNMTSRLPNLAQAINLIEQNEGRFALEQLILLENFLLKDAISIEKQ